METSSSSSSSSYLHGAIAIYDNDKFLHRIELDESDEISTVELFKEKIYSYQRDENKPKIFLNDKELTDTTTLSDIQKMFKEKRHGTLAVKLVETGGLLSKATGFFSSLFGGGAGAGAGAGVKKPAPESSKVLREEEDEEIDTEDWEEVSEDKPTLLTKVTPTSGASLGDTETLREEDAGTSASVLIMDEYFDGVVELPSDPEVSQTNEEVDKILAKYAPGKEVTEQEQSDDTTRLTELLASIRSKVEASDKAFNSKAGSIESQDLKAKEALNTQYSALVVLQTKIESAMVQVAGA